MLQILKIITKYIDSNTKYDIIKSQKKRNNTILNCANYTKNIIKLDAKNNERIQVEKKCTILVKFV